MNPTVTIELKPFLCEFLRALLSDNTNVASKRNLVGALIEPFLEYSPKNHIPQPPKGSYITFELPNCIANLDVRQNTVYISKQNQLRFQRILLIIFKEMFFRYVNDKIRYSSKIKDCILLFCVDYNISMEHISFEMLKKTYYRKTINTQKCNFFSHIFVPVIASKYTEP